MNKKYKQIEDSERSPEWIKGFMPGWAVGVARIAPRGPFEASEPEK